LDLSMHLHLIKVGRCCWLLLEKNTEGDGGRQSKKQETASRSSVWILILLNGWMVLASQQIFVGDKIIYLYEDGVQGK